MILSRVALRHSFVVVVSFALALLISRNSSKIGVPALDSCLYRTRRGTRPNQYGKMEKRTDDPRGAIETDQTQRVGQHHALRYMVCKRQPEKQDRGQERERIAAAEDDGRGFHDR